MKPIELNDKLVITINVHEVMSLFCDLIAGMMAGLIIFLPFLLYLLGFLKRSW